MAAASDEGPSLEGRRQAFLVACPTEVRRDERVLATVVHCVNDIRPPPIVELDTCVQEVFARHADAPTVEVVMYHGAAACPIHFETKL